MDEIEVLRRQRSFVVAMTRHVVLISKSPNLLQDLRAILPAGAQVEWQAGFTLPTDGAKSVLWVVEDAVLCDAPLRRLGLTQEVPAVVLLSDEPPFTELNLFLSDVRLLGFLRPPLNSNTNRQIIERVLNTSDQRPFSRQLQANLSEANQLLNRRLQALNTLYTVGKFIVSTLDHDEVLRRIMDVALNTTQAEETFILLREKDTLFLRAAKNVRSDLVERLYTKASDEVAWRVIRSGRPVMLKRKTKIATGYLARALLYVPLTAPGEGPFGVIAVINRTRDKVFEEEDLFTLSSIADFAAITLKNAQLFETVEVERSRLRALMEQAAEVILIADERGRLLLWSEAARELFHISPEAREQPIWEVIRHPDLLDFFDEAAEGVRNLHGEIAIEDCTFNTQLSYVPGLGGVVVMQDITHLKELDRLRSEFVSTVSHDLRTPLTTIQGYVALLEKAGPLNEVQRQFVEKAMDSLAFITKLITDLLDIGRIEAGYDVTLVDLRLDRLIEKTCDEMAPQAENAGITLRYTGTQRPLRVMGSAHRLRRALENLISNAIKYGREGGWVEVSAHIDADHVVVEVSDNGMGITLEDQKRLFERFYRVQRPETLGIPGTGLGLAIVKSVIEHHNGRVWVESAPDEGSTFSFILPLIKGSAAVH